MNDKVKPKRTRAKSVEAKIAKAKAEGKDYVYGDVEVITRHRRMSHIEMFAEYVGFDDAKRIIKKGKELALAGDVQCILFFVDRLIPKARPNRIINRSIVDLFTLLNIDEAQTQIFKDVVNGEMDIDDAKDLFTMTVQKSDMQMRTLANELALLKEELQKGNK